MLNIFKDKLFLFLMFSGRNFIWDENKRSQNFKKHGIYFEEAKKIGKGPICTEIGYRDGEYRYTTVGFLGNRLHTLIWTRRYGIVIRVISFRKSSKKEALKYKREKG